MRSDDEEEHDFEEDEEDDDAFRDATTGEGFDVFGDPEDLDGDDDDGDGEDDDDDDDEEDDDDDDDDEEDGDGEDDDDVAATDASVGGSVAVPTSSLPAVPTPTLPTPSLPPGSAPPSADAPPEAEKNTTTSVDIIAPQLARRSLFVPQATRQGISIEAIVGIPIPSPVHCIASTACLSYLLTGSQDGYVRAYDFWPSVNGAQIMTAQQRGVVGLGEGVNKAGVGRGWWAVEVPEAQVNASGSGTATGNGGAAAGITGSKKQEPVFSLACDPDGLWSAAGTQSGDINLYSLRHSPGTQITSLRGHNNVVSCLQLVDDTSLLSGSWDGVVREWDLNTGQTTRTYPGHGAQISAVSVRPPVVAAPAPISVNVGEDFFKKDREANGTNGTANGANGGDGDVEMKDASDKPAEPPAEPAAADGDDNKSNASYDPLFDDDAEGEEDVTMDPAPGLGLALPGAKPAASPALPTLSTPTPAPPSQSSQTGPALPGQPSQNQPSTPSAPGLFSAASARAAATTTTNTKATPSLSPATYHSMSPDILLTSSMDGQITLIDRRSPSLVGRLGGSKAPPWCMSAVWQGEQVLAGRRNGTIDIWDVRRASPSAPSLIKTLKTPAESGPISCLVAFPDGKHVASASNDNIRLWNTLEYFDEQQETKRKGVPFRIIAGHHGGIISAMNLDPTGNFLVTASGDRGWQGESTKVVLVHEVKW